MWGADGPSGLEYQAHLVAVRA